MTQAVVLVGGFGTRLSHVVKDVPKPMAPISGTPFLKYLYDQLSEQGITNFVFLTGYKADIIEKYFSSYSNITFIRETMPLGTGGALLNAYNELEDDFLLVNGDTFFDVDLSLLDDFSKDKPLTIALRYTDNISRYGFVELADPQHYKIKSFIEKGKLPKNCIDGYINGGLYKVKKEILSSYAINFTQKQISFESDIVPKLINEGLVYGLPLGGLFIDIGIPDDYYFAQQIIPQKIKEQSRPALFLDKDGTIIIDKGYTHGPKIELINNTKLMIKEYKKRGYFIVIITNQAGIAKDKFTLKDMRANIDSILECYKKENLSFDGYEYCPYHEDAVNEEFKFKSLARKPDPGMILKVCEKLRIDLKNSVMVGDNSEVDKIRLPYLSCIIVESNMK